MIRQEWKHTRRGETQGGARRKQEENDISCIEKKREKEKWFKKEGNLGSFAEMGC